MSETASPAVQRFEAALAAHRRQTLAASAIGWGAFVVCLALATWASEISLPRLFEGVGRLGDFFAQMLPTLEPDRLLADKKTEGSFAYWFYDIGDWAALLGQTVEIAILSTAIGTVLAFLMSFPAARNLGLPAPVVWISRRFLEFCRTVPELVTALIFVFAFGTGPLAGVLAIVIHTVGSLGKLFSEVVENIDQRPLEGVEAAGGNWLETVRFAAVPQVLPGFASYALIRFEANVGAAAAIGIVGAGGIGMELRAAIDLLLFQDALAMILMIIALIFVIDLVSEQIRHRLIGVEGS